ncbi:hypothetical protein H1C71_001819 [Ictidomys tridecemlineatus]|nr:hypothetical protein H1C71_001819 [Ictidomys tridecemlineatus]
MAPHLCHLLEAALSDVGRQTPPAVRGRGKRGDKAQTAESLQARQDPEESPGNLKSEAGAGIDRGPSPARRERDELAATQRLGKPDLPLRSSVSAWVPHSRRGQERSITRTTSQQNPNPFPR